MSANDAARGGHPAGAVERYVWWRARRAAGAFGLDAEDVYQECVVEMLKRPHDPGTPLLRWLKFRCSRAVRTLTAGERRNRVRAAPGDRRPRGDADPVFEAIRNEDRGRVLAALARLDPADRDVLARYVGLDGEAEPAAAIFPGLTRQGASYRVRAAVGRMRY